MGQPAIIGSDVVILTRSEYDERQRAAFLRGVERGKFEECYARSNSPAQGSAGHSGATENTGSALSDAAVRPPNFDHSKPETQELYRREVERRVELGMPRDKAEMLVAVLIWNQPKTEDAELAK